MFRPLQNRFILVIDHVTASRVPMCRTLRELGARKIVEASNAPEALEAFKVYTSLIEAVVCERDLPRVDGLAVLKAIRMGRTPLPRHLPVLLLASDNDQTARKAVEALDGTGILPRPVSPAQIAELLAKGMEKPGFVKEPDAYAAINTGARDQPATDFRTSQASPNAREAARREELEKEKREEMTITPDAVTDGMILARDLVGAGGARLMNTGDSLTCNLVEKLLERGDLVNDSKICVRREESEAA